LSGVKRIAYGHDGHERMQVNIHGVILVAYEVTLEPIARVAQVRLNPPRISQSINACEFDHWLLSFERSKVQVGGRAQERQDKTLLSTARQY